MINLKLSEKEINKILSVLQKHPFDEVVVLINKIIEQGQPQVQPQ